MAWRQKLKSVEELTEIVGNQHANGKSVVLCHGVFDLLHVGHIKHLKAAKKLGDLLVVTITPDKHVNKGPHRPTFSQTLRVEALASLACVDYIALNKWPTAVETIKSLQPDIYVKGIVRGNGRRDFTDAIKAEEAAVNSVHGKLVYTDEETYSASKLINRFMDVFSPEAKEFLEVFREKYTPEQIIDHIEAIRPLRVLTVGEVIIDDYQFCSALGKANKDAVLVVRSLYGEKYAGGILAIGNHLSNFVDQMGLLSYVGEYDSHEEFITGHLGDNVRAKFVVNKGHPTIVKRRFVEKYYGAKLFEVYVMEQNADTSTMEKGILAELEKELPNYDVVVVADYGHGLFTENIMAMLSEKANFLALNTQTNAGNLGYNTISKHARADYICISEPEVRLDNRDLTGDLRSLIVKTATKLACKNMVVTIGSGGCLCYNHESGFLKIPAFSVNVVDRVGSGDAFLSLTAPMVANDVPMEIVGLVGNVVGAEACGIMGNKTSLEPSSLYRHITSLLQ